MRKKSKLITRSLSDNPLYDDPPEVSHMSATRPSSESWPKAEGLGQDVIVAPATKARAGGTDESVTTNEHSILVPTLKVERENPLEAAKDLVASRELGRLAALGKKLKPDKCTAAAKAISFSGDVAQATPKAATESASLPGDKLTDQEPAPKPVSGTGDASDPAPAILAKPPGEVGLETEHYPRAVDTSGLSHDTAVPEITPDILEPKAKAYPSHTSDRPRERVDSTSIRKPSLSFSLNDVDEEPLAALTTEAVGSLRVVESYPTQSPSTTVSSPSTPENVRIARKIATDAVLDSVRAAASEAANDVSPALPKPAPADRADNHIVAPAEERGENDEEEFCTPPVSPQSSPSTDKSPTFELPKIKTTPDPEKRAGTESGTERKRAVSEHRKPLSQQPCSPIGRSRSSPTVSGLDATADTPSAAALSPPTHPLDDGFLLVERCGEDEYKASPLETQSVTDSSSAESEFIVVEKKSQNQYIAGRHLTPRENTKAVGSSEDIVAKTKPDSTLDTKSEAEQGPAPEAKPESQPESKPEPKPETKPKSKSESKSETTPVPKLDIPSGQHQAYSLPQVPEMTTSVESPNGTPRSPSHRRSMFNLASFTKKYKSKSFFSVTNPSAAREELDRSFTLPPGALDPVDSENEAAKAQVPTAGTSLPAEKKKRSSVVKSVYKAVKRMSGISSKKMESPKGPIIVQSVFPGTSSDKPAASATKTAEGGPVHRIAGTWYAMGASKSKTPGANESEKYPISIYTTSMAAVRRVYDECNTVRSIFANLGVQFNECDIYINPPFKEELKELLNGVMAPVPRVFIGEKYLGGYHEILELNDDGELKRMLNEGGYRRKMRSATLECVLCGNRKFVVCPSCQGSRTLKMEKGVVECTKCNQFGMVKCPNPVCFVEAKTSGNGTETARAHPRQTNGAATGKGIPVRKDSAGRRHGKSNSWFM